MTKPDLMRLACETCHFVIRDNNTPLGVIAAHVETEHPDQRKDDGEPDVRLEMVACCTKCGDVMPLFASLDQGDHYDRHYTCERCHRGYMIKQAKTDG
jgi:hypothetical protein